MRRKVSWLHFPFAGPRIDGKYGMDWFKTFSGIVFMIILFFDITLKSLLSFIDFGRMLVSVFFLTGLFCILYNLQKLLWKKRFPLEYEKEIWLLKKEKEEATTGQIFFNFVKQEDGA
jgi:hypothetical protein